MEIISLTVLTRRGVSVNQVQLVDVDDIAAPIGEVTPGGNAIFTLRELKKGPFANHNTNTGIQEYVTSETLAQIAVLAGNIFTANILTYKGRNRLALLGFNAQFVAGTIIPFGRGGSKFYYQEDSDPDLVEYTCTESPAQILAQLSNNTLFSGWKLNGNTNGSEKYIGTNDNYDFPVRANGVEIFRFKADGTIKYPNSPGVGYILTSDGTGVGTWQAPSGVAPSSSLDPVISRISNPPGGPAAGDRYLVLSPGTGAWAGHNNEVAEWDGATWQFTIPALDDYIYVTNTLTTLRWNGVAWIVVPGIAILQNGNTLGGSGVRVGSNDAFPLWLKTNNALRIRIDGTTGETRFVSNVKIGNLITAPTCRLEVVGGTTFTGASIFKLYDSSTLAGVTFTDDGNAYFNSPQYTGFALQVNGISAFQIITNTVGQVSFRVPNDFQYRRSGDDFIIGGCNTGKWYFQDAAAGAIAPLAKVHISGSVGAFLVGESTGVPFSNVAAFGLRSTYGVIGYVDNTDVESTANWLWYLREDAGAGRMLLYRSGTIYADINGRSGASINRMMMKTDAGNNSLVINAATGQISSDTIQVGIAGLVAGDIYKDTAANILANGDYVLGMKA